MSHSILYALLKAFLELICHPSNGLTVDDKAFSIPVELQVRMDMFADRIEYPSAYGRRPPKLQG